MLLTYIFLGCSIHAGRILKIVSRSSDYNAIGEFGCRNNGVLFYSNKTRVIVNKTKCDTVSTYQESPVQLVTDKKLEAFNKA